MFGTMMDVKIQLMGVDIPVLFLLYGSVCIFAYMKNKPEGLGRINTARVYLLFSMAAMATFFFSMRTYAYWIIYFAPMITFLFIIHNSVNVAQDDKLGFSSILFKNYFLECFASFSIIAGFMVKYYSEYFIDDVIPMLPGVLLPTLKTSDIMYDQYDFYTFVSDPVYYNMWTVSYAVFILYCVYLIVIEYKHMKICDVNVVSETNEIANMQDKMLNISFRGWLWIRAIAAFLFCNLGAILYIIQR